MTTLDLDRAISELTIDEKLDRMALQMSVMAEELERQREMRSSILVLTELASPVMTMLTTWMSELEAKGYFTFAEGGIRIADKVVTSFSEDDIDALGDNVVLILNTVKEMTQPEVMHLLTRTAVEVQDTEDAPVGPPPATLALLKQMRDPDVRRGLARTLTVLRSLGAQNQPTTAIAPKE